MPETEVKTILEMRQDIGEVKGILSTLISTNKTAIEAENSARSAHQRIGELHQSIKELDKKIEKVEDSFGTALEKLKENQNWLPKTITVCAVTAIVGGLIGVVITKIGGG